MTMGYIVLQNLKRNPLRTVLTLVAFALPMGVFVLAISLLVAMIEIGQRYEQQLRLGVHHKVTLINPLPDALRRQIEALDPEQQRLTAVCGMKWFGGKIPEEQRPIQSLAADADTFPLVYPDAEMSPADIEAWNKDRQAAVVGQSIITQYQDKYPEFREGGRVTLKSSVPPYLELEFHIVKVITTPGRTATFYFRRDYLTESLEAAGSDGTNCNIFWVKCRDAKSLRELQTAIDEEFANSPNETKSEDENAFVAGFTQALGNLPGLMQAISTVVLIIIGLVAGNTMMMSIRERTRELGVFKAIGFSQFRVFSIVLSESVIMAAFGALLGIVPVFVALMMVPLQKTGFLPIASLKPSPFAAVMSFVIAVAIGVGAGMWPAYQAMRLRTVDALRRVA